LEFSEMKSLGLFAALAIGYLAGVAAQPVSAQYQQPTVGCYAKGGLVVAGVCIDRRVVIR
jgi:hypothetical protein